MTPLLVILVASLTTGAATEWPTPVVTRIAVRGDTTWFVAPRLHAATTVAYCHVRGAWCRATAPADVVPPDSVEDARLLAMRPGAPQAVGGGWTVACVPSDEDESRCGPAHELRDASGKVVAEEQWAGGVVRAVLAHNSAIALATDRGLAVRDASGRWTRRYWSLRLAGDTLVHALGDEPGGEADDLRALRLVTILDWRVPNPGAFLTAIERADLPFEGEDAEPGVAAPDRAARPLARPALRRPLIEATRRSPHGVNPLILTAVGLLGATEAAPALRALLDGSAPIDSTRGLEAAIALSRLGDPAGGRWLARRVASDSVLDGIPRESAAVASARTRDTAVLRAIVALLRERRVTGRGTFEGTESVRQPLPFETGHALVRALVAYGTRAGWQGALEAVRRHPVLRPALVRGIDSLAAADSVLRDAVVLETARGLDDEGTQRWALEAAVHRLRDARLVDAIVLQLPRGLPGPLYRDAAEALVHLTGRADAPRVPYEITDEQARAAALWWSRWRAQRAASFAPVPYDAGIEAVRRWNLAPARRVAP